MKKIPTLFKREFQNHKVVKIYDEVTQGMEWVLEGEGIATVKWDGSCCAIINGELYKRYDAKKGKTPPAGAIPCCEPDAVTGHWPHWIKCDRNNASDKWFFNAYDGGLTASCPEGRMIDTYEAVGKHFNGNPYKMDLDYLIPHGVDIVEVERSFEGIKQYLENHYIEGLVFWKDGEPQCKIKRSDFGLRWN